MDEHPRIFVVSPYAKAVFDKAILAQFEIDNAARLRMHERMEAMAAKAEQ